jgi:alpha-N-arabinofuranosidase
LLSLLQGCNRSASESFAAAQVTYTNGEELAQNPGFEEGTPLPLHWTWDQKQSGMKGLVAQDQSQHHSGRSSLRLQPNRNNVADDPLAVTQIISAGKYHGQKVEFSAFVKDEGDTQAILGLLALVHGVPQGKPDMLFQNASLSDEWSQQKKVFRVPDDPSVQLVLICMSNGKAGTSWFDDVSVTPLIASEALPASLRARKPDTTPLTATIRVDDRILRDIPRTLYGTNIEWRWNALNLWQPKQHRPDPKLEQLTKDLGVTVLRYPGGMFSDFYHWKTGVGPMDDRVEVKHEPGKPDKSVPYFGTDEVLDFARQVGAEVWMTANAGTGTAQEAGDWVKYCNGQTERVRFWEVGNELYIRDPAPQFSTITIDSAAYARRFSEFAHAMRAADPKIKIAAIGGVNYGRLNFVGYPDWLKAVLQQDAQDVDLVSIHNAYAPIIAEENVEFRDVYRAMLGAPIAIGQNLQTVSDTIEKYAPARASKIKIAVTEWGPAFRFDLNSKWVDHPKTLGSALFAASVMNTLIQSPKVEVANFLMLHDFSVYGAIGSRNTDFPPNHDWVPTARYYAFQLYTKHFGSRLLSTSTEVPTFDTQTIGYTEGVKGVPYLDVIASLSEDGRQLYIVAVNKDFDRPINASISLAAFAPVKLGTAWTLNGSGLDANTGTGIIRAPGLRVPRQQEDPANPRFYKGGEGEITFASSPFDVAGAKFTYRFPAHSVTSLVLTRR